MGKGENSFERKLFVPAKKTVKHPGIFSVMPQIGYSEHKSI
jgi:hypothetical protein